jgi:hypothetical protein
MLGITRSLVRTRPFSDAHHVPSFLVVTDSNEAYTLFGLQSYYSLLLADSLWSGFGQATKAFQLLVSAFEGLSQVNQQKQSL